MKYVAKGGEPHEMLNLKRKNKSTPQNLIFGNLPKPAVRSALLRKQGWICGYTMMRLDGEADCHIEHMLSYAGNVTGRIDFDNFLACYPPGSGPKCEFGAHHKAGSAVNPANFVFPTDPACESRFEFGQNGKVRGLGLAAENTVMFLNLNHDELVARRLAIFRRLGLTSRPTPQNRIRPQLASARKAHAIAASATSRDPDGKLAEFCVAIAQVASVYAERMDKTAQRLRSQRPDA